MNKLDKLSRSAVQRVKLEINTSYNHIANYSVENPSSIVVTRIQETEVRCILKKIVLLKHLRISPDFDDLFNQVTSDLLNVSKYLICDDSRAYALTLRSVLENMIRIIMEKVSSSDHVTINLLNDFNQACRPTLTDINWSFIMKVYNESSTIIHFHSNKSTIDSFVVDCFPLDVKNDGYIKHISDADARQWRHLFRILEELLCEKYKEEVMGSYSRKVALLKYLTFKESYSILQK